MTTEPLIVYERRVSFGMLERSFQIGAYASVYRDEDGVLWVTVRATRNSRGFGATKARVRVDSVDAANAVIGKRIAAMFNRYKKTATRFNVVTVEECVKTMLWDGVPRDGLGRVI